MSEILVVDDEPDICSLLKGIFEDDGNCVRVASNSSHALKLISDKEPDLIILDIWLQNSDLDGIEILKKVTKESNNIPIVIISGHGNIEVAVEAVKLGAYDFIEKPFNTEQIRLVKNRAIESRKLKTTILDLKNQRKRNYSLVGDSQVMRNLKKELRKLSNRNSRILLTGETGVGKETAAGYIHSISSVHTGDFVVVLCSSISDQNFDEMFCGKEESGVICPGIFDKTKNGVVYLKEITDLPIIVQNKLLNILAINSFKRYGGNIDIPLESRIISGSSFNSKTIMQRNMIRLDLFHRLNVIELCFPPLASRKDDISELSFYFLEVFHNTEKLPHRSISEAAINELRSNDWLGNVLQLRNLIERILILGPKEGSITKEEVVNNNQDLINHENNFDLELKNLLNLNLKDARAAFERYYLEQQIKNFDGNITKTAKHVGMERSALHRKINDLKAIYKEKSSHIED